MWGGSGGRVRPLVVVLWRLALALALALALGEEEEEDEESGPTSLFVLCY